MSHLHVIGLTLVLSLHCPCARGLEHTVLSLCSFCQKVNHRRNFKLLSFSSQVVPSNGSVVQVTRSSSDASCTVHFSRPISWQVLRASELMVGLRRPLCPARLHLR